MTRTIGLILSLTISLNCLGQKTFRKVTQVNPTSTFISEFIIDADSLCYYNKRYVNNSQFYLYKGKITRLNDTSYKFIYQPIVEFGCNKRVYWKTDSVFISILTNDTTLTSLIYAVETSTKKSELDLSRKKSYAIKNAGKENFDLDTKFHDPRTNKKIVMTISPMSEPVLTYYGTNSKTEFVMLTIINNKMTVHRGEGKIWRDDILLLEK